MSQGKKIQRQLSVNHSSAAKAMERLSSGLRINRAGDDAAGLAISEKMRGQIRGLNQAIRNAQDGISLIQTAEGALQETHAILQRMRELAVQAASDTNTEDDRKEIQKEIDQLAEEITRIGNTTQFNTMELLNGSLNVKFHIGANSDQSISLSLNDMRAEALGVAGTSGTSPTAASGTKDGITFTAKTAGAAGNSISIVFEDADDADDELSISVSENTITVTLAGTNKADKNQVDNIVSALQDDTEVTALVDVSGSGTDVVTAGTLNLAGGSDGTSGTGTGGIDVSSQAAADQAVTIIDNAIGLVSAERSKLGALQNRLEHTIANLGTSAENLQAAESRIRDVDMAAEMMVFTKYQILQQASTAMLAQANMAPQSVLQLLG